MACALDREEESEIGHNQSFVVRARPGRGRTKTVADATRISRSDARPPLT